MVINPAFFKEYGRAHLEKGNLYIAIFAAQFNRSVLCKCLIAGKSTR